MPAIIKNRKRQIVYKAVSDSQFEKVWIQRAVAAIAIGATLYHIGENPIVLSIAAAILIIIFLLIGRESIVIYNDGFDYQYGGIIKLHRTKTYLYKDLKEVTSEGFFESGIDNMTDNLNLPDPDNSISILLKNGEVQHISSTIYKSDIEEAVIRINFELDKFNGT